MSNMRPFLCLLAAVSVFGGRVQTFGDEPDKQIRLSLHKLYEACRVSQMQTGRFPSSYRDLEGIISVASRKEYSSKVEFRPPELPENVLRRKSPVGDRTPCLRLQLDADRWLNVACTGWVYQSEFYWETEFVDLMPRPFMAPELLAQDCRPMPERVTRRSDRCGPDQVDLARRCNALPTISWVLGPGQEKFAPAFGPTLSDGLLEDGGILFDARGVIQLDGEVAAKGKGTRYIRAYPRSVNQVVVGREASRIHLLAGTIDRAPDGVPVAILRLNCDGQKSEEFQLRYGQHFSAVSDPAVAPGRLFPKPDEKVPEESLYSLHHVVLEFSKKGTKIDSLDFVSAVSPSHPFLLAVTVEP
jgi:hypothetical protein